MGYLTLKVRAADGGLAYQTDFSLHELIPLVRTILRRLERRPDLAPGLAGYRAVITPGYDRAAAARAAAAPWVGAAGGGREISLAEEIHAYFNPGTSPLCRACPERHRCPGGGRMVMGEPDGWIVLDPLAPRTNQAIRYLTVRIEATDGRSLHEEEVSLAPLEPYVMMVSALLRQAGQLPRPARGRYPAEIVARHDGEPAVDPMLGPAERLRLGVRFLNLTAAPHAGEPPPTLVDWDRIEQEEAPEIQLLATESPDLPRRSPPGGDDLETVGRPAADDLPLYVHRAVLAELRAASREGSAEVEGLLVGEACRAPEDGRTWIEIAGHSLTAPGQGRRTVGWYRSHLLTDLHVASRDGHNLVLSAGGDRLAPTRDERFFHRHFFPEPWHVGLIVDGLGEGVQFYRCQGGDLVVCAGFVLLD